MICSQPQVLFLSQLYTLQTEGKMVEESRQAGAICGQAPLALQRSAMNKPNERVRRIVRVTVAKEGAGPFDADVGRWPDPKERAALWSGEPPILDESWVRRVYNDNKELADYLGNRVCIKVGRLSARTLFMDLFAQEKNGS